MAGLSGVTGTRFYYTAAQQQPPVSKHQEKNTDRKNDKAKEGQTRDTAPQDPAPQQKPWKRPADYDCTRRNRNI